MGAWSRAARLAAQTPPHRNRYVDMLRAMAILVVVFGHWLAAAPYMGAAGDLEVTSLLGVLTWSQWLTWALQVMPVFFIVGGFSNAASWEAALRQETPYHVWLHARLTRLVAPIVPLLLFWAALAGAAGALGVDAALVTNASRLALVPTWFLAVYIAVVMLVPAAWRAWQAYGLASFWIPVSVAVLVDALAFGHGLLGLRWLNYAFVWLAVHQLGFLWRAGRADDRAVAAGWALGGLAFLVFLVEVADYPVSMLTVPGAEVSNSRPPTVALVALAAMQFGFIVALQPALSKWLERQRPWTAVVLVNGFIMTLFLWHSTVQVLVIGAAARLGGIGLDLQPGSVDWWLARPAWIGVMLLALLPVTALLARFEQGGREGAGSPPAAGVQLVGGVLMCLGLAFLALQGMGDASFPWIRIVPLALALGGAAIVLLYRGRESVN